MFSKNKLINEINKIQESLDHWGEELENGVIDQYEHLYNIRPLTRAYNILDVMRDIHCAKDSLNILAKAYYMFYQLGTPEDFLVDKVNESPDSLLFRHDMLDYQRAMQEVKGLILTASKMLAKDIKKIKIQDSLQDLIDSENT